MHDVWAGVWGWTMSGRPLDFMAAAMLGADRDYCTVAKTWLYTPDGVEVEISTVFLVATVTHDPVMPGDLFETMVFVDDSALPDPGPTNAMFGIDFGYKVRYATYEAALSGHVRHVRQLHAAGLRPALGTAPAGSVVAAVPGEGEP